MITLNDILDSGCMFQGPVKVVAIDCDNAEFDKVFYEGDGEDISRDEDWGEHEISYIFYDKEEECIQIELAFLDE